MQNNSETTTKINSFITQIKRGQLRGRFEKGKITAELLQYLVSRFNSKRPTSEIISNIRSFGLRCTKQIPTEMVVVNIIRRVLYLIRDEYAREKAVVSKNLSRSNIEDMEFSHQPDLISLLEVEQTEDFSMKFEGIKPMCLEGIKELKGELEDVYTNITDLAIEHIHANEVILTFGHSNSVEAVLLGAMKKRKFHVIVTNNAPSYSGNAMAEVLSRNGIHTTLISNSSIFAVMSRVNKVVIGASSVMAKGGLIGNNGIHQLCLAAKYFSVPVVVISGLYKMTPLFPVDQDSFNNIGNPEEILPFQQGSNLDVQTINPEYDYVPPHLVTLFITNIGTYNSNYIYRLLSDYYSPLDYTFQ